MFIARELASSFLEASDFFSVLLLTGARQVGKTTFLRRLAESGRRYVSLDPLDVRDKAEHDPRLFLADNPPPVIIDEIQYVPSLLPYIKEMVDKVRTTDPDRAHGMYWLTGSQKFALMQGVTETLAGRLGLFELYGLSQREVSGVCSAPFLPGRLTAEGMPERTPQKLFREIWLGSYPELVSARNPERRWGAYYQSYVQTYLERDVRKLSQVADLSVFHGFLKSAAARSGQMLNYSDLARDTGISVPTAKRYLSILETSNIVRLLYPYRKNRSAETVSTPKLYFADTGLMAFLTGWNTPEPLSSGAMAGHFLETWCVSEIIKSYANHGQEPSIFYFRTKERNPSEIDIVLEENSTLYPIEVKRSARLDRSDVRHFSKLEATGMRIGTGALLNFYPSICHLTENVLSIPVTLL
ncbi:MAG: ATP-binding protein [Oligosphaeraceae bacterium]